MCIKDKKLTLICGVDETISSYIEINRADHDHVICYALNLKTDFKIKYRKIVFDFD